MAVQRSAKSSFILLILAMSTVTAFLAIPGQAQVAGATVVGTVMDQSGSKVVNAQILITNTATMVTISTATDPDGLYTVPNLIPGTYRVTIRAQGFATEVRSGITLAVGEQLVLNQTLHLGQASETIRVQGETPIVELASPTISGTINGEDVRELPLNGRDWTLLADLQAGVSDLASLQNPVTNGSNRGIRGYGTQMSIDGGRPQQNNYRIDGISVNDAVNSGPDGVLGIALGVDAISEFSVLGTNYSAEYGRTSGGVVNAVSRSGTNSFHGDVYEFLRNNVFDAPTYLDDFGGISKPPFKQNQFGAAAGGPILKGRAFFFVDYEGLRQSEGVTSISIVPSQSARSGLFSYASSASFPAGCVATSVPNQCQVTVSPVVVPYLPIWPLPNDGILAPGNTGNFAFAGQQVGNENFGMGRVDYRFSDKDSAYMTYQYDSGTLDSPDPLDQVLSGNIVGRQFAAIEETHSFSPQFVNNTRVGYNRSVNFDAIGVSAISPLAKDTSLGLKPGVDYPTLTIGGIATANGGLDAASSYTFFMNSFQAYEDAFLTKGKHEFKFGGGIERSQTSALSSSSGYVAGVINYGSLYNFETNSGTGNTIAIGLPGSPNPTHYYRQTIAAAYLQDDFRLRPHFTVNLGMRYEMSTVPHDVDGRTASLLTLTSPEIICGKLLVGCSGAGPLFQNPTYRNFDPRVGFAWDPFHSGKTSVRSGFGIYDILPLAYTILSDESLSAPFVETASGAIPPGGFPDIVESLNSSSKLNATYVENRPGRSYTMQWNVSAQREVLPDLTVMVAYLGSRGIHMLNRPSDVNGVIPTLTPQGYEWPCPSGFTAAGLCKTPGQGTKQNPAYGQIGETGWHEDSTYHAFELEVTKMISHDFQLLGSYTWSRSTDEGSAGWGNDSFVNGIKNPLLWVNTKLEYGPSDYNIPQRLVISGTWQMPSPHTLPIGAGWLLRGWQPGGVFTLESGTPFSIAMSGDPLGTTVTKTFDPPNYLDGPGCHTPVNRGNFTNYVKTQCFSFPNPSTLLGTSKRNSVNGPGMVNLDFSMFKNNYIKSVSEDFNVQFRVEAFNSLNHPNWASPVDNDSAFTAVGVPISGFGEIDALATPAREIQFAVKVIW